MSSHFPSVIAKNSNARLKFYLSTAVALTIGVLIGASTNLVTSPVKELIGNEDLQTQPDQMLPSKLTSGVERLHPQIVVAETDLYLRRLWGNPDEDLLSTPKYLATFTVSYEQRMNIDACVRKFSKNFTIILFHYDGRVSDWNEFPWFDQVIHMSVRSQTKWWYSKRFLHPDVVAPYEYIFIWDEDLGLENFDPEEYLKILKKHRLEIAQPGIVSNRSITWRMVVRQPNVEIHRSISGPECPYPEGPPCADFVEIMAPTFSREAWRCVWSLIQNDLGHGWGLDFTLHKCVDDPNRQMAVVDSQWIEHYGIPSLVKQDESQNSAGPGGVKKRCYREWEIFNERFAAAEKAATAPSS